MSFSPKFEAAIAFTLPRECEYQHGHYGDLAYVRAEHDPNDPGGTTKFGIDARDHPGVDVENLTLDGARAIYHAREWTWINGDALPELAAVVLFDCCVNPGRASIAWLQNICGVLNDGMVGPVTAAAIARGGSDALRSLLTLCERYYRTRSQRLQAEFLDGWLNRNNARRALLA